MIWLLVRAKDNNVVNVYTVHEPPEPPADRLDRAQTLEFIKDGFSWGAALFSPFYFALKGQWFGLALYAAAALCLTAALSAFGADQQWTMIAMLALNIFAGFEASSIERGWLTYRGWTEIGTVSGRNAHECERRFFETWLTAQPMISGFSHEETPPPSGWRRMLGVGA